jgi:DNA-binding NarL/FixJ family response regulator
MKDRAVTKRQQEINDLEQRGFSKSQIAQHLGISVRTVEGYIYKSRNRAHPGVLTKREEEIAELIKRGLSNSEIGETLGIAKRTAESYRFRIVGRLGLTTSTRLTAKLNEELVNQLRARIEELESQLLQYKSDLSRFETSSEANQDLS